MEVCNCEKLLTIGESGEGDEKIYFFIIILL